jgi:hypothetical protein
MKIRVLIACGVLALLAPSCKTWVKVPEHAITIVADSEVKRGGDLAFCVTLKDASGQQVYAAVYEYKIEWVGVGGLSHKAKTGLYEKIRGPTPSRYASRSPETESPQPGEGTVLPGIRSTGFGIRVIYLFIGKRSH